MTSRPLSLIDTARTKLPVAVGYQRVTTRLTVQLAEPNAEKFPDEVEVNGRIYTPKEPVADA